jgi:hypothetical protein
MIYLTAPVRIPLPFYQAEIGLIGLARRTRRMCGGRLCQRNAENEAMFLLRRLGFVLAFMSGFMGAILYTGGAFEIRHKTSGMYRVGTGKAQEFVCVSSEHTEPNLTPAIPVAAAGSVGVLCTVCSFLPIRRLIGRWRARNSPPC